MKYFEFGREHPELMVILHGGGVCYRGALPVEEEMAKLYHVVLVASLVRANKKDTTQRVMPFFLVENTGPLRSR